tara:strand:- start:81 stop:326 length:246 start_codon:yes stop_codon:yes gene_type:complete
MARTNYVSKGERKNVSKWVRKAIKRERTGLQRANTQLDAFLEGKNVVLTIPNPNPNEKNKPFVRKNAKEVWSRDRFIMKQS